MENLFDTCRASDTLQEQLKAMSGNELVDLLWDDECVAATAAQASLAYTQVHSREGLFEAEFARHFIIRAGKQKLDFLLKLRYLKPIKHISPVVYNGKDMPPVVTAGRGQWTVYTTPNFGVSPQESEKRLREELAELSDACLGNLEGTSIAELLAFKKAQLIMLVDAKNQRARMEQAKAEELQAVEARYTKEFAAMLQTAHTQLAGLREEYKGKLEEAVCGQ